MTAFQPVFDLTTSTVVGAEALTRFVSDSGDPADYWFAEAEDSGLRTDLEFAALESGLEAALKLPAHLFVALKLSDEVCLDPRLPGLFEQTPLAPARVILEVSGKFPRSRPLRSTPRWLRCAVLACACPSKTRVPSSPGPAISFGSSRK